MVQEEQTSPPDALERVPTGGDAFHELAMGGLPRQRITVVSRTPGSDMHLGAPFGAVANVFESGNG